MNILKNKAMGFYVTCFTVILAIVTAIVHVVSYADFLLLGTTAISWPAVWLLIGGTILAAATVILKKENIAHYITAIFYGLAFFFFIYGIYYYISIMAYGIDAHWDFTFFLNAGLFTVLLVVSLVNVFLKQSKDEE